MIKLLLDLEITKDLLGEPIVHPEYMIDNFNASNSQTQNGLGKQLLKMGSLYSL